MIQASHRCSTAKTSTLRWKRSILSESTELLSLRLFNPLICLRKCLSSIYFKCISRGVSAHFRKRLVILFSLCWVGPDYSSRSRRVCTSAQSLLGCSLWIRPRDLLDFMVSSRRKFFQDYLTRARLNLYLILAEPVRFCSVIAVEAFWADHHCHHMQNWKCHRYPCLTLI